MTKQLASFFVASCLTVALQALAQDNLPGSSQSPSSNPDCSDPLLASSSQCSAQGQNQTPLSPPNPTTQPGQNGMQPSLNFNYTDNENPVSYTHLSAAAQKSPIARITALRIFRSPADELAVQCSPDAKVTPLRNPRAGGSRPKNSYRAIAIALKHSGLPREDSQTRGLRRRDVLIIAGHGEAQHITFVSGRCLSYPTKVTLGKGD